MVLYSTKKDPIGIQSRPQTTLIHGNWPFRLSLFHFSVCFDLLPFELFIYPLKKFFSPTYLHSYTFKRWHNFKHKNMSNKNSKIFYNLIKTVNALPKKLADRNPKARLGDRQYAVQSRAPFPDNDFPDRCSYDHSYEGSFDAS